MASGSLPAGLALNASTGLVSGTPTVGGSYTFTINATNAGGSVSKAYTVAIAYVAPTAPAATAPVGYFYQAYPDMAYSVTVQSVGNAITYSKTSGTMPTGLTLNPTTGVVSGTPSGATADYTFTIKAANPAGSASTTFTIRLDPDLPTI